MGANGAKKSLWDKLDKKFRGEAVSEEAYAAREPVQQGGWERRSLRENGGRVVPSCRCRTAIWCRSTTISTSLSQSPIGSSRSNANTPATLR